ncbi:MAG: caspase family protein [Polaromonas sp.]
MKQKPTSSLLVAQKTGGFAALALAVFCADILPAYAQQNAATRSQASGDRNLLVQAVAPPAATNSTQRLALVIGNAAYKDAPLVNPVNDARAFAQALKESGFTVILRENTDQRALLQALREFGDRLRAGGTGLFYYAGHGMQIKGRNYLIPVGAAIEREDEVAYNAVDAQAVLDKMEAAGNPSNIMILDACRNNPFTRSTRSGQAGLAQMDAPVGTLVAFSTSPGAVASDGSGANGLYTQHLLTAVRQNGSKIEDVFKQVRSNVRRDSQGKQVPWEVTSLEGDFYFRGAPASAEGGAATAGAAVENALWDAVKASDVPIEVRAYLGRYPNGLYAAAARERLARLQPAVAVAVPVSPARPATQIAVAAPVEARFSVGDYWNYTGENQLTGTRSNYSRKVSSISANGDKVLNDGSQLSSAAGHTRYLRNAERERFYSDGYKLVPSQLRAGFKEAISYSIRSKYKDGSEKTFNGSGTLEVMGREKVSTPAGQFMAWRIHRLVRGADTRNSDTSGAELAGDLTVWYVPEINSVVATENTDTNLRTGKVSLKNREALTGFCLMDAATASAGRDNMALAATQPGGVAFMTAGGDGTVDQAAVNKRTDELLATIAAQKPSASGAASRPSAFRNSFGMTTGDLWRYQTVDRFKKEVVANWSRRIDSFNSDGSIKLNDGGAMWTPSGAIKLVQAKDGTRREYTPEYHWLPATLKAGYTEPLKHTMRYNNAGGENGSQDREGTLTVLGKETIKVPAGEFEAWKIEASGFANGKDFSRNSTYTIRFKETFWYVPALRNFVASEFEQFNQAGQIQFNSRQELTSFSVRGAENLAQR